MTTNVFTPSTGSGSVGVRDTITYSVSFPLHAGYVPFGSITVSHVFAKSGLDLLLSLTHTVNTSICSTTLVLPFVYFLSFPLATSSLFLLPPLSQALPNPNPNPDPVIHNIIIFAHNKDNYFLHSVRRVQCLV